MTENSQNKMVITTSQSYTRRHVLHQNASNNKYLAMMRSPRHQSTVQDHGSGAEQTLLRDNFKVVNVWLIRKRETLHGSWGVGAAVTLSDVRKSVQRSIVCVISKPSRIQIIVKLYDRPIATIRCSDRRSKTYNLKSIRSARSRRNINATTLPFFLALWIILLQSNL